MGKYFYSLLFLSISYFAVAQTNYEFDYVLEYKYTGSSHKGQSAYRFINSHDSSYIFNVWEDKNEYGMLLTLANSTFYYGKIAKEDFFVEAISLKCPGSGKDKNDFDLKDYKFEKKSDTLINAERFSHFIVSPLNKKEIKKHKLSPLHYIIDNTYNFSFPVVKPNEVLYKMWKKGFDLPNGVVKEIYSENDGSYMELIQCVKTKKYIFIDRNCR